MAEPVPFIVEPMAVADLPGVMSVERLSFSSPWSEQAYRYEIDRKDQGALLVVRRRPASPLELWAGRLHRAGLIGSSGRPVLGFGGLWLLAGEAHISTLAVHPDWRGQGLGELLLLSLLDRGAAMGATTSTLEVRESNHVAQGLYEKYWFDVVGRQRRYYTDNNEDALIMATPPFSTPEFQTLLARNRAELYARLAANTRPAPPAAGQNGRDSLQ